MNVFSYLKRAFLNPVSTLYTSYILAHVEDSQGGSEKNGGNLIIIADCDHKVKLEFFLGSKQARRRSLAKINLLIDIFTRFREALVKESDLIDNFKKNK